MGSPRPPFQRFFRRHRLGSTTPLGRPGTCRPLPAQNTQIDTMPPAYHTTPEGDVCAATKQLSNTFLSYSHRDWDEAQRADPLCDATRRYINSVAQTPPPPRSLCDHLPSHKRLEIADITELAAKGRLLEGDNDNILVVRKKTTTDSTPDGHNSHRRRRPFDDPVRIYVPLLARPWVMHASHLGVTRTLKMLERFYWWVGMEVCTKWWVRRCLKCQARKTSRQTIRWPTLSIPLPNSPGISVSVDYFGPLPTTARRNSYILLFTDRFSRRADMFAVTAAEFTAKGTANILVNRFIPLWGCPSTLLSDNGLQFCVQLATAVYKLLGVHKLTTSAYHPSGNGGVERVNHTMAQMLAMVCNEHQNDWGAHLSHVEYAYNNSVNAATGLAPNEVHIERLPRLPRAVLTAPTAESTRALTATTSFIATSPVNGNNEPTSSFPNRTPSQWPASTGATPPSRTRSWADPNTSLEAGYGYTTQPPQPDKDCAKAPITKFSRRNFLSTGQAPSKSLLLVPPRHTANPTDALSGTSYYILTSPRICPALPPSLASLWFAANLAPTRTIPTTCLDTYRPVSPNTFYTLSRTNRLNTTSLPMTSPHPQYCSTSPKSLDTSVCPVEAAPLPFYIKPTGTDSFAPHGNVNLASKLSEITSSHIGPLDQHSTSLRPVNINNCALTQPPARSPAQKGNATSRTPTDSSRTMFTVPDLCLTPYPLEPPSGTSPLTVPGG